MKKTTAFELLIHNNSDGKLKKRWNKHVFKYVVEISLQRSLNSLKLFLFS